MGGSNSRCLEAIKNYLVSESDDKKKTVFDVSDWKLINKTDTVSSSNKIMSRLSMIRSNTDLPSNQNRVSGNTSATQRLRLWCFYLYFCRIFQSQGAALVHAERHAYDQTNNGVGDYQCSLN